MDLSKVRPTLPHRIFYIWLAICISLFTFAPMARAEDGTGTSGTETTETTTTTPTEQPTSEQPATATEQTTTTPPAETQTTPPPTNNQGPTQPTGASGTSYTYNEATGLWENDKYTWDPNTNQTAPKQAPSYSYNPETGMWDTTEWVWDAPSGNYVPNVISLAAPPADAVVDSTGSNPEGSSNPTSPSSKSSNSGDEQSNSSLSPLLKLLGIGAAAQPSSTSSSTGVFDLFYNALISNKLSSTSVTGDALVSMNTLAGNALSGDASAIATVFNLLHSVWNLGITGSAFNLFTQNLFGDVIGDLWLQPPSGGSTNGSLPSSVEVNASQNAAINNEINLEATSGDATVSSNTEAGNATSGTASVIANIINAINSSIVSGNSFVGMLNIYGNLNGDILLPQELISTLLAANTLGQLNTSPIANTEVLGEFTNNLSTTNNVNAGATTGGANVTNNTEAGNATSGDANTNVTVLNLTGRQVIGKNALLVFVNVLGTWVGMIVDAPTGSTSAAFGGGITGDSTLAVSQNNNQAITNDINAHATSGDATVSKNTKAGDATSGDAYAAVNILNMNSSQFALSDWFGVLFINVFGTWNGSFGVDTAAGTIPVSSSPSPASAAAAQAASTSSLGVSSNNIRAFAFSPQSDGTYELTPSDDGVAALAEAQVLSTSKVKKPEQKHQTPLEQLAAEKDWSLALVTTGIGLSLLGVERYASRRQNQIK